MIERVIQLVMAANQPSSADNLAEFSTDAVHYLGRTGVLDDIEVHQAVEPHCLVDIEAVVTDKAHTLQDVSATLKQAWTALAYSDFEASSCVWYADGAVLRFVTAVEERSLFVSGVVVARGEAYARLVERFEQEFGDVHGGLRPMPKREV